ncbi:MAG: hypothetical protein ACLTVG_23260 [Coprococcus sp.]
MSRKRVPLNQNECTADFRIGVPFEQNLQFEGLQKDLMDSYKKNAMLDEYSTVSVVVIDTVVNALLYILSGLFIIKGEFTIGGAFAFITY